MLYTLEQYIPGSVKQVLDSSAIGLRVNYSAVTGMAAISTANSNLDGTGSITNLISGSSNGTLIRTITIKASGNTTRGMVRLFLTNGTFYDLIAEVDIPERTQDSVDQAFSTILQLDFILASGLSIAASTQNAESFELIAEGLNTTYP
jgi:hypothetical protein